MASILTRPEGIVNGSFLQLFDGSEKVYIEEGTSGVRQDLRSLNIASLRISGCHE